jgi:hypothetical protein
VIARDGAPARPQRRLLGHLVGELAELRCGHVRHVSSHAGDIRSDLLDRRSQLRIAAPGDEDVGALADEPLRRRQADAAIATGDECDFPFQLSQVRLLYGFSISRQARSCRTASGGRAAPPRSESTRLHQGGPSSADMAIDAGGRGAGGRLFIRQRSFCTYESDDRAQSSPDASPSLGSSPSMQSSRSVCSVATRSAPSRSLSASCACFQAR